MFFLNLRQEEKKLFRSYYQGADKLSPQEMENEIVKEKGVQLCFVVRDFLFSETDTFRQTIEDMCFVNFNSKIFDVLQVVYLFGF